MKYIRLFEDIEKDIRDYLYELTDSGITVVDSGVIDIDYLGIKLINLRFGSDGSPYLSMSDVFLIITHLDRINKMGEFIIKEIEIGFDDDIGYTERHFKLPLSTSDEEDLEELLDTLTDSYTGFDFNCMVRSK